MEVNNVVSTSAAAPVSVKRFRWLPRIGLYLLRHPVLAVAALVCVLGAGYWGLYASDRYVSEAHVIIQHTDIAGGQPLDFAGLLGNMGGGSRQEQLQLRDYLLSSDLLRALDQQLHLRQHFSDHRHDLLSRLWSRDAPQEVFYSYAQGRISVEFDDYAGVLLIKSQAYDRAMAHAITSAMVQQGERYMNDVMHRLARNQVSFLEKQVEIRGLRATEARKKLVDYQNEHGLVSPQGTVESVNSLINKLQLQLIDLQTRRAALATYLASDSADVVELDAQIATTRRQMAVEQSKLTASGGGKGLNRTIDEFQRLQMDAQFASDIYNTALMALEKGRVEATRTMKMVSVLQAPSMPEYSQEPRRLYNILLCVLVTLAIAGIVQLLLAIIRDHRD